MSLSKRLQAEMFNEPLGPSGFEYRRDLITITEEAELVAHIERLPLAEFRFQQFLAKRRVMYFGWRYDFENSRFEPTIPMPSFLLELRSRAASFAGLVPEALPHALVTEYSPGTEIGWHRDRPVFEDIIGVSLISSCQFRFRRKAGPKWERYKVTAEPRSVYLMRGSSRWDWEHSIPAVESLRYSVTFRSLRDPRNSQDPPEVKNQK